MVRKLKNIKLIRFYLWVAFAFMVLGVLTMRSTYPGTLIQIILNNFWAVVYVTLLNFILFEYSVPFVLKKRKNVVVNILFGLLLLFFHMILYSYGLYSWRELGIQAHLYTPLTTYTTMDEALQQRMEFSMESILFFGIIRHIYNYIQLKNAAQQLQIEKQAAELNYLRSQTNPHFLFNTLNNIYSLSRDKSDLAPESILRLSKILRFMLYETRGAFISIGQEVKIISDYISLEQLRYDESLKVNFNHDIEDMNQAIPPLLLIALVENAFKHGVSETTGRPFIDIHLSVNKRQLSFTIKNSSDGSGKTGVVENIGLSNIRRQLELLYKDFNMIIAPGDSVFTATLRINLASHV
ncbi:MAG TPA: histidine kinase [Bacteroidales bacterium]|jgi:sensor histidine kinase YesM|nr:histidine kinase [Bacteroidales bacterium]